MNMNGIIATVPLPFSSDCSFRFPDAIDRRLKLVGHVLQ
jgi:hypothetical protein